MVQEPVAMPGELFGSAPIAGFAAMDAFLSPAQETTLIRRIDATRLSPFKFQQWEGKRLTTSYGSGYNFEAGRISLGESIPAWLDPLRVRAAAFAGLDPQALTQALLIRYDPGAGIGWHRDRPFYDHVIGISLGAQATMRFRKRSARGFDRIGVRLAARGIYHLTGEARHAWEHSIAALTETRWSITFRSLSASGLQALGHALPHQPAGA